ncbi:probable methyltransferase At1g27930 [Phoenix dactylifera]|uniref:Probable methyltransferase At1g27930 n=1 Tax=Phoenix dactylifera TaxID=42345 RepID=A0A8B7CLQ5_PHODC|nr:probable methyltransferase At1g27930 [Phoenix dactylifera]
MRAALEKPLVVAAAAAALVVGALLVSSFIRAGDRALLCSSIFSSSSSSFSSSSSSELAEALLHYATTNVVPQQSRAEMRISFDVLRRRAPCNFLVFGLGHDSLMWSAFNAGGTTVFLEEDPKWFQSVTKASPALRAHNVRYRTQLIEADDLIKSYRSEPSCLPPAAAPLKNNHRCRLALADLPAEIFDREWDLIMIDAPKGYYNEAPGRMAAIFSAAVMARSRRGEGETDIFLHDVNRKVEKMFAMEFLCKKHLVGGTGRLWHFRIPPVRGNETSASSEKSFC